MRAPLLVVSSLALGLSLAAAAGSQATAATPSAGPHASTTTPPMDHDMADMGHGAPDVTADRSAAIQRAELKPTYFAADMNGLNLVQASGQPSVAGRILGDRDGRATGLVRVQGDRITFALSWENISAPTVGHIHEGDDKVNGPVKVSLFDTPMPATATAASGVLTVDDPATADAIRADPDNFYLNLHTEEFPAGAVRGQLSELSRPADLLGLLKNGAVEQAFLSGDQEVAVPDGPAGGDPTGRAVAFVKARSTRIDFSFAWTGIKPTLGHLHKGRFGANGPVAVPLFTTAVPSTIVAISGTATGLDSALVEEIAEHPSDYYANLHTAEFPDGAVRGQLFNQR
ncbi:CHRD domain-containing protein [Micromonospora sp. WP24]|uniref:CHRD domain-containing protein n=1 Tax=Micromonospora sp. WP24 TaxID=2604469 RepID=UPI0011D6F325|nr:CHRD domain-containing protein [Micromonospora sp. WP24]TYB96880.1 CHRD domain-containing protein [Micromonospora sp. WP24]